MENAKIVKAKAKAVWQEGEVVGEETGAEAGERNCEILVEIIIN